MKRVVYLAPIDHIVGKLPQAQNVQGYVSNMSLQGRMSSKNKNQITRLTLASIGTRTTQPSEDELAARARFASVAATIKAKKLDSLAIRTDAAEFKEQTAIKTFNAFLWDKYGKVYDAAHPNT